MAFECTKVWGRTYICSVTKLRKQPSLSATMKKRMAIEAHINIKVPLIVFKEEDEGIWYAHCPVLDITGYGKTQDEAKNSFEIVLEETVEYMITHGTLHDELRRLGWSRSEEHQLVPPDMGMLLKKEENEELRRMMALNHWLTYSPVPAIP